MTQNNPFLAWRYPSLRVAYVEEKEEIVEDQPQKVYSSLLVKAVNGYEQVVDYSDNITAFKVIGLILRYLAVGNRVQLFNIA